MYPGSRQNSGAYDRSATMFSPDGRLYQVEYAAKIIERGTIGLGIVYKNGILFGADKMISSKLIVPESIEKLFKIDDHIAAVSSGLVGDARRIVQAARQKSQENLMYYDEPIHVETLCKEISSLNQLFTQYGGMRPFGVSFIIGGVDETGFRLFETEPSGALAEYTAIAIGAGRKEAMDVFEKDYSQGLSLEEALKLMVRGVERSLPKNQKLNVPSMDFAVVDKENMFRVLEKNEVKSILSGGSKQ